MEITIRASTTHGKKKPVNQDNYGFRCLKKDNGWAAFSVVCDGVGGLSQGEKASEIVTRRYLRWFDQDFINIYDQKFSEDTIKSDWEIVLKEINEELLHMGEMENVHLGTTAAVLLICNSRFYCMNIGDTRIYCISDKMEQISVDHSLMQLKLDEGTLSVEDIDSFPEKNVLFQCIGFNEILEMTFRSGKITENSVWLVCSDGFRNRISQQEIFGFLDPAHLSGDEQFGKMIERAVQLNLQRNERDDITLVATWLDYQEVGVETHVVENCEIKLEKENSDMYCSKCGCKCRDDDRFCSRCGAPLVSYSADDNSFRQNVTEVPEDDSVTQINKNYACYDDDETQVSGVRMRMDYDDQETQLLGSSSDMAAGRGIKSEPSRYQGKGLATKKVEKNKKEVTAEKKKGGISRVLLIVLCVILVVMILLITVSTFL